MPSVCKVNVRSFLELLAHGVESLVEYNAIGKKRSPRPSTIRQLGYSQV